MLENCLLNEELSISLNIPFIIESKSFILITEMKKKIIEIIKNNYNFSHSFYFKESNLARKKNIKIEEVTLEISSNKLERKIHEIVHTPFNLLDENLIKLYTINSNNRFYFICMIHHLIFDFVSRNLLIERVMNEKNDDYYSYESYVKDQKNRIELRGVECVNYFSNKLKTHDYNFFLRKFEFEGIQTIAEKKSILISKKKSESILEFCSYHNMTINVFFIMILHYMHVSKYQSNFSFLKIVEHGRFKAEHEKLIGMCRNYLPFLIQGNLDVKDLIDKIKNEFARVISYQGIPYFELESDNEEINFNKDIPIYYNNLYDLTSYTAPDNFEESIIFHNTSKYTSPKLIEKFGVIIEKDIDNISMKVSLFHNPKIGNDFCEKYLSNLEIIIDELIEQR
jgi:hypothetical protein